MNATVYYEPYKVPAGILALAVHCAFFVLLYFGFTWQTQPAATMSVELWQSLPDTAPSAQPQPKPKPQPKVEEAVRPVPPKEVVKPDIALPDKKKIEPKPVVIKPEPIKQAVEKPDTSAEDQAVRERAAAVGRVVDEYTAKIQNKIRREIVMPPSVADDARAEFLVTLLPGGTVLKVELKKSSGNAIYDDNVERAIWKASPLPLPADVAMFNKFRELKLDFRPKE